VKRGSPKARGADPVGPVAQTVQRLAVLLAAGVAPGSAWGYVAEQSPDERVRQIAATDATIAEAILDSSQGDPVWRSLAAAWRVATDAGAPLAPTLRALAQTLRDLAQTERDVSVALAAPAATARMVLALPLVGLLFGAALGFDTLGILFGTAAGFTCLALGAGLMLAARLWNRRLLRAATPTDPTPGLQLELLAIALSGGASVDRARAAVSEASRTCGLTTDVAEVDAVLALSVRAGVPAAALLRSEAEQARLDARSDGQRRAAKLAVTLMIPLGVCVLPAFMLLGVAPLMIAVVSSTVSGL
jgi:tight adherence protein B